jgi:hypothetical protein
LRLTVVVLSSESPVTDSTLLLGEKAPVIAM